LNSRTTAHALLAENINLASWVARRYHRPGGPDLDDLEQVALIALHVAARRFDTSRGVMFSTCVEAATYRALGRARRRWRSFRFLPKAWDPAAQPDDGRAEQAGAAASAIPRLRDTLPPNKRELVRAKFGTGTEARIVRELGQARGVSHQTVAQTLRRALARMRAEGGAA
jgi:RNA polymerase sigma factor (sigma-70 family)